MRKVLLLLIAVGLVLPGQSCVVAAGPEDQLDQIKLPKGFKIEVYAYGDGLKNARQMALGDNGTVFVGSRNNGKVFALQDTNNDNKADKTTVIFDVKAANIPGAVMPSGIAFKNGSLYVSAVSHIFRFDQIESKLDNPGDPVVVTNSLPDKTHHGWKFIAFGPDDKLYVPVGAPCNICDNSDTNPVFASITRMNADGSGQEIVAHGVRNTVGFDWHPETGELWFTENGRDMMGDDMPADELNRVSKPGQHYGYPYIHQGDTPDPKFGEGKNPSDFVAPEQKLGAHVGALGMRFYRGDMFPARYKNQIFIAEHGSWNRSEKSGYRIMLVRIQDNKAISYETFATGFLPQGSRQEWARPSDVMEMPDGALLVADDKGNAVYRISYEE